MHEEHGRSVPGSVLTKVSPAFVLLMIPAKVLSVTLLIKSLDWSFMSMKVPLGPESGPMA